MTAMLPVANVLRVVEEWKVGADLTAMTGQFYQYTGPPPNGSQCTALAEQIGNSLSTHCKGLLHTGNEHQETRVLDLASSAGAAGAHQGFGNGGLTAGTAPPANCAFVMSYKIAQRQRGGKPRNYFPFGASTTISSPQTWEAAWVLSAREGVFGWLASIAGMNIGETVLTNHVSVSYFYKGTWVNDPVTGRPRYIPKRHEPPLVHGITAWTGRAAIGSQRRRLLN
jgi:hypothetical protein